MTLPSTLIVALFFMGLDNSTSFASRAAAMVPAEMGINAIFLVVFIMTIKRGLPVAMTSAMGVWFVLSSILYLFMPESLPLSILILALLVAFSIVALSRMSGLGQKPGSAVKYGPKELAFRGLFAGLMLAISIMLATSFGPVMGGIFSVFPAVFTSTMVILYLRQGVEFTGATGRTMVIGSINVAGYAVLVHFIYPAYGLWTGTLLAVVLAYVWSYCVYKTVERYHG